MYSRNRSRGGRQKPKQKSVKKTRTACGKSSPTRVSDDSNIPATNNDGGSGSISQQFTTTAFHNHVIVEKILLYLDFASMKALMSVNQRFKQILRTTKTFLDRAKVSIKSSSNGSKIPKLASLKPDNFPWKNVAVELKDDWKKKEIAAILRVIPNISSLELTGARGVWPINDALQTFATILRTCTHMKALTIDASNVDIPSADFGSVVGEPEVVANVRKLDSLWIRETRDSPKKYFIIEDDSFGLNIQRLGEIPAALARFGFQGIQDASFDESDEDMDIPNRTQLNDAILSVLKLHKATLTSIALEGSMWESQTISALVFPNLKELSLVTNGKNVRIVVNFLKKQPLLTRLSLKFDELTSTVNDLDTVLQKHSSSLKQFRLKWRLEPPAAAGLLRQRQQPDSDDSDDDIGEPRQGAQRDRAIDHIIGNPDAVVHLNAVPVPNNTFLFSCLSQLEGLEQVKIHQCYRDFEGDDYRSSLFSILSELPAGIREINIGGTPFPSWMDHYFQSIIECLASFRNLTVLNLVQCPAVVNDKVLTFICSQLDKLLELGFSHCRQITDVGITGKKNLKDVVPGISALTGLRKLQIICCDQLSRKGFLASIRFPELRDLTLVTVLGKLNQDFYLKLLAQNKCLEQLRISTDEMANFQKSERNLKRHSDRFRELSFVAPLGQIMTPSSDEEGEEDFDGSDFSSDSDMDDYYFDPEDDFEVTDDEDVDADYF